MEITEEEPPPRADPDGARTPLPAAPAPVHVHEIVEADPAPSSTLAAPTPVHVHEIVEDFPAQNGEAAREGGRSSGSRRRADKGGTSGHPPVVSTNGSLAGGGVKNVDPKCLNASNPYHVCTDRCSSSSGEGSSRKRRENSKSDSRHGKGSNPPHEYANHHEDPRRPTNRSVPGTPVRNGLAGDNKKVDPKCVNASNPYHVCAGYCSKGNGVNGVKLGENRNVVHANVSNHSHGKGVDRANASNPSHENANDHKDPRHQTNQSVPVSSVENGMKNGKYILHDDTSEASTSSSAGLKIGENRKADPNKSPRDNSASAGRKNKGAVAVVERIVLPGCVNASNPYHTCSDYCKKKMQNS